MKKKVLITQPWPTSYVTEYDSFVRALEEKDCEVILHPKQLDLNEDDVLMFPTDLYATVCGSDRWTARAMDRVPTLKMISRIGVGYDSVDVSAATQRGIAVCTTPGANSETVAEAVLAMMLACGRQIKQGDFRVRNQWEKVIGPSLYRKTLGIIGLGTIGKLLVKLVKGFDMKIIAYDKFHDEAFSTANDVTYLPLDDLLAQSDFISVHTSLNDETRGMIGEREFKLVKPSLVLVNCARGGIVDENALYSALKNKVLFGAAFDVFATEPLPEDSPLLELDNLLLMPHNAGTSYEGKNAVVGMAVQNLIDFIDGKKPKGFLNPEVTQKDMR